MGRPFKIREPGEMCCPFCNRQFPNNIYLNRHICSHIQERPFMCRICGKDYIDHFTLWRHLASHEEEAKIKCDVCSKGFKTKYQLNRHKKTMHSVVPRKKYKCETCGTGLSSNGHLKRHIESVHLNLRSIKCSMCPLKFADNSSLKLHMVCHTGEKPFACNLCPKRFGLGVNFRRHMMTIHFKHPEDERTCSICGKTLSTKADLKNHVRRHQQEKSIECKLCSRKFRALSDLRGHMRTHTGERYHSCSKCQMQFVTPMAKLAHEKRNNCWMQSLVCVFCDKDFRNRKESGRDFQDHVWKHIGERPYLCTKCPDEFYHRTNHKNHVRKCHIPTLEDLIA